MYFKRVVLIISSPFKMKLNTKRTPFSYIKIFVLCFTTILSSQSVNVIRHFAEDTENYGDILQTALNDVEKGEGQIQLLNNSILYKNNGRYGEELRDKSNEFKIIGKEGVLLFLTLENEHFLAVPLTSIQGIMYSLEKEGDKYVHEWKVQLKQLIFDGRNMPK